MYLGSPLGGNPKNADFWSLVQEKIFKKLDRWKRYQISRGVRLTLCTSALGSIPLYYLSLFQLPVLISKKLEKSMRLFLWGDYLNGSLKHLVRWDTYSLSRDEGGLGVGH